MDVRIEVHINLIPFGNTQYSSKGGIPVSEVSKEISIYQTPQTTDVESVEFSIYNDITLAVPPAVDERLSS